VLSNLNFTIKAGEKIGIVGMSGSGKSSILQALFRLSGIDKEFAPDAYIKIDGIDIKDLGLHYLRSHIGLVPQTPFLFSGSIKRNLDLFESTNESEMWDVLEAVGLKGFVEGLPKRLDTDLNNIQGMSMGQKQMLCLARLFLRSYKIVVLDEITSNLDFASDRKIHKEIRERFKNSTVIRITHRIGSVMMCDRVMVVDKGIVVEFDAPFKLLVNSESDEKITRNSLLAKMCKQAGPMVEKAIFEAAKNTYLGK